MLALMAKDRTAAAAHTTRSDLSMSFWEEKVRGQCHPHMPTLTRILAHESSLTQTLMHTDTPRGTTSS